MDINEIEGLVNSIITDEKSTEDCRRAFEKNLARLESKGANFVDRTFLRHRNFFRDAVFGITQQNDAPTDDQATKLKLLANSLNSVSKADAFALIQRSRSRLRKQIPELKRHDEIETIVTKNLGELSSNEQSELISLMEEGNFEALYSFGKQHFPSQRIKYYTALSEAFPEEIAIERKLIGTLTMIGRQTNDIKMLEQALEKISRLPIENDEDIVMYADLAFQTKNRTHMEKTIVLLEPLRDKISIILYAMTAKELKNDEAMTTALEKMEDDRKDISILVNYGNLARIMKDTYRMEIAMNELEAHIDNDEHALIQYAALAKDLRDETKMETAMFYLVDHLNNIRCLTIYATIVNYLNDQTEMKRCMKLLKPLFDENIICTQVYKALANGRASRRPKFGAGEKSYEISI